MSAVNTEAGLASYLQRMKHCPHCFEPATSRGSLSLTDWYRAHTSACLVLKLDPDDPIKGRSVSRCKDCGIVVFAAFFEEHSANYCGLLRVASDAD